MAADDVLIQAMLDSSVDGGTAMNIL